MDFMGFASVPVLVIIVYLVCQSVKATPLDHKWLPIIAGAAGGALGVVALYVMPEFPAGDVLTAIAVGIASGFAATGVNQVYKQLRG